MLDLNVTSAKTYEMLTWHLFIRLAYLQHFRCQISRLAKFSHQELVRLCVVMRRECIEKKLLNAEIPNTSEIYNSYTIWVCSNEIGISLHSMTMRTLDLKEWLKWLHFNGHTVGFCSYTRRLNFLHVQLIDCLGERFLKYTVLTCVLFFVGLAWWSGWKRISRGPWTSCKIIFFFITKFYVCRLYKSVRSASPAWQWQRGKLSTGSRVQSFSRAFAFSFAVVLSLLTYLLCVISNRRISS